MTALVSFLFLASLAVASSPKPAADPPFAVPARYGAITDFYPGSSKNPRQTVVMIQDLHANVGVQKNIAAILYRLLRLNKTSSLLVCVEGASGEGDVSLLRSLPGPIRHGFEAMLLHKAYLTGAELAATEAAADWPQQQVVIWSRIKGWFTGPSRNAPVSLSPIQLWGVDDPDLYRKNWRAAKFVDKNRFAVLATMRQTKGMIMEGAAKPLQQQLTLLTKLLMLRLQPKEYKDYLKGRSLNPKGPPLFEKAIEAGETYYVAAEARSVAMANNLLSKMGRRLGYTVLVTGGFHTQEIAESLKKAGVSYVVVTPRVQVLDQDDAYRARLREEE
jgi:hypothetical protein